MGKTNAVVISLLCVAAGALSAEDFTIVSRYPPRESPSTSSSSSSPSSSVAYFVKEGEPVRLSCSSSSKFNLCRWGRPGGPRHHVCGIFSSDREKQCAREGSMSRWRVIREDERTCAVEVDAAAAEEAGEWNCEMQSYPDPDGEYKSAQEYTHLVSSKLRYIKFHYTAKELNVFG